MPLGEAVVLWFLHEKGIPPIGILQYRLKTNAKRVQVAGTSLRVTRLQKYFSKTLTRVQNSYFVKS